MGKDPAWLSRTIRELQADFATVHATPNESGIIRENLARWESLLAEALRNLHNSTCSALVSALRLAAEIQLLSSDYHIIVVLVGNSRYRDAGPRQATLH